MPSFAELPTVRFAQSMRSHAESIYQNVFPASSYSSVEGSDADRLLGIDAVIRLRSGCRLTLQEKYRSLDALKYGDFTIEARNGDGSEGEFGHLSAQLYFYGWGDADNGFLQWLLIDVTQLKMLIDRLGGLAAVGQRMQNSIHGSSVFYCIPLETIMPAVIVSNLGVLTSQVIAA